MEVGRIIMEDKSFRELQSFAAFLLGYARGMAEKYGDERDKKFLQELQENNKKLIGLE